MYIESPVRLPLGRPAKGRMIIRRNRETGGRPNGKHPGRKTGAMSKKLFVGSLSWDTTDEGLHEAFAQFGEITEAKVITDRDSGRSRGFGFVTFNDDEAADKAMSAMNGFQLDGRPIRVDVAQDRRGGGGGDGGGGGHRGGGGGGGW